MDKISPDVRATALSYPSQMTKSGEKYDALGSDDRGNSCGPGIATLDLHLLLL